MSNVAIRYTRLNVNRSVDEYKWNAGNGHVCKVPAELAAELLTDPSGEFVLADEPVSKTARKQLDDLLGVTEDGK